AFQRESAEASTNFHATIYLYSYRGLSSRVQARVYAAFHICKPPPRACRRYQLTSGVRLVEARLSHLGLVSARRYSVDCLGCLKKRANLRLQLLIYRNRLLWLYQ